MAKRKLQPAVMNLLVNVPAAVEGTKGEGYVDLSQCASIINRRFYRQGLQWIVSGFSVLQNAPIADTARFTIEGLPLTWVQSNSWHKAYAMWKKQQDDVIDEVGGESAIAKFRDFKIFMDSVHVDQWWDGGQPSTLETNLLPVQSGGATFAPGEWEPSQIVLPNIANDASGSQVDPYEYYLHSVGVNNNAFRSRGIISGYESSRAYPQSPDPVAPPLDDLDNWMRQMFDVGGDNILITDNVTVKNDDLPYPQEFYPGGEGQAPVLELRYHTDIVKTSSQTATHTSFSAPGGMFPCGLIKFGNETSEIIEVMIHLAPGNHRGYFCEPMQDM